MRSLRQVDKRRSGSTRPWLVVCGSVVLVAVLVVILWDPFGDNGSSSSEQLVLFCAAGMSQPVEELVARYQQEYGVTIQVEFGGSGKLLSKIRVARDHGDLFLAADDFYTNLARSDDPPRVIETIPVAMMHPVIALSEEGQGKVRSLDDLLKDDVKVVLANPELAAVGRLSQQLLSDSGHWEPLERQKAEFRAKISFAGTVNEVANALKIGAADAGIIWGAMARQRGLEMIEVPSFARAKKQITLGVLNSSKHPSATLRFARYLASREPGMIVFEKWHFKPIPDADAWKVSPELQISSGAMLRPGIEQAIKRFELREGVRVNRTYNGCGLLVAQMKAGTRPDAYFSCDVSFMDEVQDLFGQPIDVSENDMVILVPTGSTKIRSLSDLTQPGLKLGLAHPENSALGVLTKRLLDEIGYYQQILEAGSIAVESATGDFLVNQMVTGALDGAIVYRSNAMATLENLQKYEVLSIDHPQAFARQPFAVGKESENKYLTLRLRDMILSDKTEEQFGSIGFRWTAKAHESPEAHVE